MLTARMPSDGLTSLACENTARAVDVYTILCHRADTGESVSSTTFKKVLERNPEILTEPGILAGSLSACIKGVSKHLETVPAVARSWSMIAFEIGDMVMKSGDQQAVNIAKSSTSRNELFDLAAAARLRSDRILESGPDAVMAVVKVAEQIRLLDEALYAPHSAPSLEHATLAPWPESAFY